MNRILPVLIVFACATHNVVAQHGSGDSRAISLIQRSVAALTGTKPIEDVTLMGTARRLAGSDDESGGVIAKALITGESRIDFNFVSGQRNEIRLNGKHGPAGTWSGPDGASHQIAAHNLLVDDSAWFSPSVLLQRASRPSSLLLYVGATTLEGKSVEHLAISRQLPNSPFSAEVVNVVRKASCTDLYLDSETSLPLAFSFNTHPDNDIQIDIPIQVRFSDYRNVNGSEVPFRVQKFIRGELSLDLQFQSATANLGLSAASMNIQ